MTSIIKNKGFINIANYFKYLNIGTNEKYQYNNL